MKKNARSTLLIGSVSLCIVAAIAAGCSLTKQRIYGNACTSVRPQQAWIPPDKVRHRQEEFIAAVERNGKNTPRFPPHLLEKPNSLSLTDIIAVALLNSKQTSFAWDNAVSALAAYRSERGSYFPSISASASAGKQKSVASGTKSTYETTVFSPLVGLTWLLFDFGGREASVDAMREALFAADFTHNASIQNVILQVDQAFYDYYAAKALLQAQEGSVDEQRANLTASEDRHSAGLATIADVLQARTAMSQSLLTLETLQGQIQTARGVLATAMGLSADVGFDVLLPIGEPPLDKINMSVKDCLDTAIRFRPDLAASRETAMAAAAHAKNVGAQLYPSITAGGGVGELYYQNTAGGSQIYNANVGVTIPLFFGFSHYYNEQAAKAQANAAVDAMENTKDLVVLQVWTSYYNLQTAQQVVLTSNDLLSSASQNHDVAIGRYKAGVGTILDLLTAQAALESARAQQVLARAQWYKAFAQLAHDCGMLTPDGKGMITPAPSDPLKGKKQ